MKNWILMALVCGLLCQYARADALDDARQAYHAEIDKVDQDLTNALTKHELAARKVGDQKTVSDVKSARDAFEMRGEWPKIVEMDAERERVKDARARMQRAYDAAIRDFTKAGKDDDAKRVADELDTFKVESDLPPWVDLMARFDPSHDVLHGAWDRKDPGLISSGDQQSVARLFANAPDAYRLELLVTRQGGTRGLTTGFPVGSTRAEMMLDARDAHLSGLQIAGKRLLNNETTYKGDILPDGQDTKLLLTVRRGQIKLEAGDKTVVDWHGNESALSAPIEKQISIEPRGIFVGAAPQQAFWIQMARIKTIAPVDIESIPATTKPLATSPSIVKPAKPTVANVDVLPINSHWTGQMKVTPQQGEADSIDMVVVKNDGKSVTFRTTTQVGSVMDWTCELEGHRLVYQSVTWGRYRTKSFSNSRVKPELNDGKGEGRAEGQTVSMEVNFILVRPAVKNQPTTVDLALRRAD
jgi:hypothetical protein